MVLGLLLCLVGLESNVAARIIILLIFLCSNSAIVIFSTLEWTVAQFSFSDQILMVWESSFVDGGRRGKFLLFLTLPSN